MEQGHRSTITKPQHGVQCGSRETGHTRRHLWGSGAYLMPLGFMSLLYASDVAPVSGYGCQRFLILLVLFS